MSLSNDPPILPIRPSDSNSKFLAQDLFLAYPLFDGGDAVKNYGTLGEQANLTLSGVNRVRYNGLSSLEFNGIDSLASNESISLSIPDKWSLAYWVKFNNLPIVEANMFTIQGPSYGHLRAWADTQGIWAWQKHSIADTYSILPASDLPVSGMMLIIAIYEDPLLPPAQLRTNQGMSTHPAQPDSYVAFNESAGTPAQNSNGIYLGGGPGNVGMFSGIIGPLYMWSRPISETEVWQLWQDPYAPFRRNTEQNVIRSTLISTQGSSLQGIGKPTGTRPMVTDENALLIVVNEYAYYVEQPNEVIAQDNQGPYIISIGDSYFYSEFPIDSHEATPTSLSLDISIADSYNYILPSDVFVESDSGLAGAPIISIVDSYSYAENAIDSINTNNQEPEVIIVIDSHSYEQLPNEVMTNS